MDYDDKLLLVIGPEGSGTTFLWSSLKGPDFGYGNWWGDRWKNPPTKGIHHISLPCERPEQWLGDITHKLPKTTKIVAIIRDKKYSVNSAINRFGNPSDTEKYNDNYDRALSCIQKVKNEFETLVVNYEDMGKVETISLIEEFSGRKMTEEFVNKNHKNIRINKWFERTGNNIYQLIHTIKIGLYYNCNIILPTNFNDKMEGTINKFVNTDYIVINNSISKNDPVTFEERETEFFFTTNILVNNRETILSSNNEKTVKILKEILTLSSDENVLGDNDLLLHIRSGDIFIKNPHPNYIMPPVDYYVKIIESKKWDNVYLIAEDRLNPSINKLLELYPNIIFEIRSLYEDIQLILNAKTVVSSYGTFVPALLTISEVIETLYSPNYIDPPNKNLKSYIPHYGTSPYKEIKSIITPLHKYKEMMTPWENSKIQRYLLVNYDLNNEND